MPTDREAQPHGRQNELTGTLREHAAQGSRDEHERERHKNEISPINAAGVGSVPPRKNAFLTHIVMIRKNEIMNNQAPFGSVSALKGSLSSFV